MKFVDKLNKYNQKISFNIFALNGYNIMLIFIYWTFLTEPDYSYIPLLIIFNAIITSVFIVAFIVFCIEIITQYKIPFGFLKYKQYSLVLLFGTLISIIYLVTLVSCFLYGFMFCH